METRSGIDTAINEKYDRRVIIISPQECSNRRNPLCKYGDRE